MANFGPGPNFRVAPPGARPAGGAVSVRFDASRLVRVANQVAGEAALLSVVAKEANTVLAIRLQERIAKSLEASVKATKRFQRQKPKEDRLASAIRSERNRIVSARGYTVGYLDDNEAVAPYFRNLERGSGVHVNRYLSGGFFTRGVWSEPTKIAGKQRDSRLFQVKARPWRYDKPWDPGVKIKKRIPAYHYFRDGIEAFRQIDEGDRALAAAEYRASMLHSGVPLIASRLRLGVGNLPQVSGTRGI